jgi:hypothetical protein
MLAIEGELVKVQRGKLSAKNQMIFIMTYECFVMWALKRGMDSVLERKVVESAVVALQQHFAKHAWYQPDVFEKIWDQIQNLMPLTLRPTDKGIIYPAAEMIEAANQAGYPLDPMIAADLDFGMHVLMVIQPLAEIAQLAAKEHSA